MPLDPMTAPRPDGLSELLRRIEDIERKQSMDMASVQQSIAHLLSNAGLSVAANTLTVGGNLNVTGTETVGGNLNVTGTENVSGALNVTGPMTVGGTLSLPNGIINNDALASPVSPDWGFASASNYPLPAGQANRVTRASFTLTVPAGYTKALIQAWAQDTGVNSTGTFDYLQSYVSIGGGSGRWAWCPSPTTPAGYSTTSLATSTYLMTGLTGGQTITIASQPYTTNAGWVAATGNGTILAATCLYLR